MKTLFVGNLPSQATVEEVTALFTEYGKVRKLELPRDIFSGRNKGFALVSMEGHEARAAMTALNGKSFMQNTLKIRDEKPKQRGRGRRR
jgi:RNA recognition motif-containing protein